MPQEPKKRHSRQRKGKRRASIRLALPKVTLCQNCKTPALSHIICKTCGFYKGKQLLQIKEKKKRE